MLQNLGFAFSSSKLKANLKMANTRMQLAINKKTNAIKVSKREIASMLKEGKEEKARIRVEPVIRDDFTIEAYEILSLICELLVERMRIIESQSECPADLVEGLSTLIYAADRIDVAELVEVKKQIKLKYGKDFIANAEMNTGGCCNERVVHKLSLQPPSAYLCINYLQEIAHNHNVDWAPPEDMPADPAAVAAGSFGYSVPNAPGSEFSHIQDEEKLDPPMVTAAPINDKAPRTGLSGLLPTRKKNNRDNDHGPGNVPSEGLMPNTRAYPGPNPSTLPAQGAVPSAPPEPTGRPPACVPVDLSFPTPPAPSEEVAREELPGNRNLQMPEPDSALSETDLSARLAALKQSDDQSFVSSTISDDADKEETLPNFNEALQARIKALREESPGNHHDIGDFESRLAAVKGQSDPQPDPSDLADRFESLKAAARPTPMDPDFDAEVMAADAIAEASFTNPSNVDTLEENLSGELKNATSDALTAVEAHLALIQNREGQQEPMKPNTVNQGDVTAREEATLMDAMVDEIVLDQKHEVATFESEKNQSIKNEDALIESVASSVSNTEFDLSGFVQKLAAGIEVTKYNLRGKAQSRTLKLIDGGRWISWQPKRSEKRADLTELESVLPDPQNFKAGKQIYLTSAERNCALTLKFECGRVLNLVCKSHSEKDELANGLMRLSEFSEDDLEHLLPESV